MLLARLAAFSGGWSQPAAAAVCSFTPIETRDLPDLLASLADKSLVLPSWPSADGEPRFQMLKTLRQYAEEKLAASNDNQTTRDRHRDWFLALAERAGPNARGEEQLQSLPLLDTDYGNLHAALDWCDSAEHAPEDAVAATDIFVRLPMSLGPSGICVAE